jgi:hypothetical protein
VTGGPDPDNDDETVDRHALSGLAMTEEELYDELLCPIRDILPGDEVLSLNEATEALEYAKINKLMDMGIHRIYELTTKSGRTIRTTAAHPYLTLITDPSTSARLAGATAKRVGMTEGKLAMTTTKYI